MPEESLPVLQALPLRVFAPTCPPRIRPAAVPDLDAGVGREDLVVQRDDGLVWARWRQVGNLRCRQGSFSFLLVPNQRIRDQRIRNQRIRRSWRCLFTA